MPGSFAVQSSSPVSRHSFACPSATPELAPAAHAHRQVRWGSNKVFSHSKHQGGALAESAETSEDEEEPGLSGIVLAMTALRDKVGCCYYDPATQKIFFLEDQQDSPACDLASTVLEQLLPANILTSAAADVGFLSFLEEILSTLPVAPSAASSASSATADPPVRLEFRPAREFYVGQGRHLLSQVNVTEGGFYAEGEKEAAAYGSALGEMQDDHGGLDDGSGGRAMDAYLFGRREGKRRTRRVGVEGDALRRSRELRLEGFLNGLEASPLTLGCAAALLTYISRTKTAAGDLQTDGFEVAGLELMRLDKVMLISADALASLQIFDHETHASMHSSQGKEGLSLFGIVNIARTPLGRALMRQWFVRPSLELDVIEQRQATVECFLRLENYSAADSIRSNFRLIKNAPKSLKLLMNARGGLREWQTLWEMLYGAIMIRDASLTLVHVREIVVIEKLCAVVDDAAFREAGKYINDLIDWETAALQNGRICVRSGVDADLDELRRQLHGLPSLLSTIASDLAAHLPHDLIPELSIIYYPQLGYLVRIPYDLDDADMECYMDIGFEFQFVSEKSAYFKNDKCRDLDRHLGDLQSFIAVQALLDNMLELSDALRATTDVIAELDCLLAFAEAARLYNWNRPTMTEEPVCKILGGRHPLAELCVNSFVMNDTDLVGGRGRNWQGDIKPERDVVGETSDLPAERSMIIVTGANFSGKSIYLKQVALITFMAHLGCFVPAEKALIGLTDRIMARVTTKESITKGSSAFMIDLQQISFALRNTTPSSLLIIDEFGKGTESGDGAGLFCGVVEYLLGLGAGAPRVAIATHFQMVFMNGLLSRRLPVYVAHMEIIVDEASSTTSQSVGTSSISTQEKETATAGTPLTGGKTLTYLYHLAPGLTTSSHAAACASLFGISPRVVSRARDVTHALSTFDMERIVRGGGLSGDERNELEEGEAAARGLLEWDLEGDMEGEGGAEEVRRRLREMLASKEEKGVPRGE
ncbi:hypothetical protein JCM1841_004561 [Sporobolomyces salmonicolor]